MLAVKQTHGADQYDRMRAQGGKWFCLRCFGDALVDPMNPGSCPHCGAPYWSPHCRRNIELGSTPISYYTDDPRITADTVEVVVRYDGGWRWMIVRSVDGMPLAKGPPHKSVEYAESDFLRLFAIVRNSDFNPEIDRRIEPMGAMTKQDPRTRQLATLRDMLGKSQGEIEKALPRHIKAEYMMRVVMTSIQVNPELLQCEPKSVLECVMKCSQLGLAPDGVMGEAYLIPFKDRKAGVTRCTLIPGYRGLQELARRSGYVTKIFARVVHEGDKYEIEEGLQPVLKHVPAPESKRGRAVAYYAVATFRDRDTDPQFVWMWKDDIDAHRKRFASSRSGPWDTDFDAMARKTVIRRLCNELPKARELQDLHAALDAEEKSIADVEWSAVDSNSYSEPEREPEPPQQQEVLDVNSGTPDAEPDADAVAAAIQECYTRLEVAESLPEVDGVLSDLDSKYAVLPAKQQDRVRKLAADVKANMRKPK